MGLGRAALPEEIAAWDVKIIGERKKPAELVAPGDVAWVVEFARGTRKTKRSVKVRYRSGLRGEVAEETVTPQ